MRTSVGSNWRPGIRNGNAIKKAEDSRVWIGPAAAPEWLMQPFTSCEPVSGDGWRLNFENRVTASALFAIFIGGTIIQ